MGNFKRFILPCIWLFSISFVDGVQGDILGQNVIKERNTRLFLRQFHRISKRSTKKLNCSKYESRPISNNTSDNRTKIHIGLLLPFVLSKPGREYYRGGAKFYSEAFNIAIEHINNDPFLLPGYKLEYVFNDTRCNELDSIKSMYYQYKRRDELHLPLHGFIGLGCQCGTAAKFASAMKVPVVSHMCSSPDLSKKELFPTFARTFPLADFVIPSIQQLLRTFNWTKVAVIYSNDSGKYHETSGGLLHALKNSIVYKVGMKSTNYKREEKRFESIMPHLKQNARIIIFYMDYSAVKEGLLHAHRAKMNNGDYLFIIVELDSIGLESRRKAFFKWYYSDYDNTEEDSDAVKEMLLHCIILTLKLGDIKQRTKYEEYINDLKCRTSSLPFHSFYYRSNPKLLVPLENIYLYDAVQVLALALNKTLSLNESIEDGMKVVKNMEWITYQSIDGNNKTIIKNLNSRDPYSLLAHEYVGPNRKTLTFSETGYFDGETLTYKMVRPIPWFNKKPPKDSPRCGFKNEKCPNKKTEESSNLVVVVAVSVSTTVIGVILLLLPIFMYRQFRLERELTSKLWKVSVTDLAFVNRNSSSKSTLSVSHTSLNSLESDTFLMTTAKDDHVFGKQSESRTIIAVFKGTYVAVKEKRRKAIELNRDVLLELKQMRDMRHDNINQFIGASIESERVLIVTQYALRGSLEDVLLDNSIKLETLFLLSLIYDIVKLDILAIWDGRSHNNLFMQRSNALEGMIYLHASEIKSHGNLKSSNCVIDSRWVLKITDFGLHSFREKKPMDENSSCLKQYLWHAPELLRMANPPARGTEKGDVYSFAIILQECHTRMGPWSGTCLPHREILKRIRIPELPPFRPTVSELIESAEGLRDIMKKCWLEHPDVRPTFPELCKEIDALMKANGLKRNIVDNMIYMMERYTDHLEDLVEQKTGELVCEKRRIETLLERMLPASVARQLKLGREVEAETFKHVSIYFSDIVGFTELCAGSTPMQVVKLLNDLYTLFDNIIKGYSVYKVETIGDAYMVVSGLPIRNEEQHASEIALMALHINSSIKRFKIHHRPNESLNLRIGINSGPVVAGVVGTAMPRYCLFGDTVNTASRMESTGAASKIHISESTKNALEIVGGFMVEKRGTTFCKGKGEILTFWLVDVSADLKMRIEEHDKQLKFECARGSQLSLNIFSHSPTTKSHGTHVPGLLRNSPDGTPLQLRRAVFLKNIKKNKGKLSSLDIPDPDSVPLLNRITNGTNGIAT